MRVKLDENLPASLAAELRRLGHEADTVPDEGLAGQEDGRIWGAAQGEGRFLITQDLDFSDLRRFAPGTHAGLLLVRLRSPSVPALKELVLRLFLDSRCEQWNACFVVATDHKLRIKRP
ncbi:MAG TPA: DUF5615 family PIN-like protein [Rhodocyclaceae bacterium]|nr:DUF5615 family PIN-like protein [Rhodocyclaceae bacterium]